MTNLKIYFDYLPIGSHYNNLRYIFENIKKSTKVDLWKEIIKNVRETKKYKCEICNKKFNKENTTSLRYLHCHELWMFDYENKRQILKDILLLCNNCHNTQHIQLASLKKWEDKTIEHFKKVNNLTNWEFNELKNKNLLFRKNYIDNNIVSKQELDEVEIWFFKNECAISKYFENEKELGIFIENILNKISNLNY